MRLKNQKESNLIVPSGLDLWKVDVTGRSLQDSYNIQSNSADAIYVHLEGNTINIDVTALITGDAALSLIDGSRAWEWIVSGIKDAWSGDYWVDGKKVNVKVNFAVYLDEDRNSLRHKYITIKAVSSFGRSHASDLDTPDNTYNWSRTMSGAFTIYMGFQEDGQPPNPKSYTAAEYSLVAAHEFGHLMGIGDAYKNEKLGLDHVPLNKVSFKDIMRTYEPSLSPLPSAIDIRMMLKAWSTNQYQKFDRPPIK
jgi:hypothetical protein